MESHRLLILAAMLLAPLAALGQGFDGPAVSNTPASVPSSSWPPVQTSLEPPLPEQNAFPASGFDPTTTPAISPNATLVSPDPAKARTPIRRNGQAADTNGTDSTQKPQAADMLRQGAWNSGIAVLALALGGVLIVTMLRKKGPQFGGGLPREACDVLGRKRIDPRTSISLVRVGNRILVLGTSGDSVTSLAEITDPVEIDQLAGLCRLSDGSGLPSFGNLLRQKTPRTAPETASTRRTTKPRASEPAELPARRGLRPGQKLDLTTPD